MLGRFLGEVPEAVVAAEADHEFLGCVDVLAADRALIVVRPLDFGDVLGRFLGEVPETVVAAEVDGEELGRIDVLAADRAFLVEADLLRFLFLYFFLF